MHTTQILTYYFRKLIPFAEFLAPIVTEITRFQFVSSSTRGTDPMIIESVLFSTRCAFFVPGTNSQIQRDLAITGINR